jgi:hypothetical protein
MVGKEVTVTEKSVTDFCYFLPSLEVYFNFLPPPPKKKKNISVENFIRILKD